MHTGSAERSKPERLWLALATVAGLTLLEAAQLLHGVQQALRWCGWAMRGLVRLPRRAGRMLVVFALRRYGWELGPARYERWHARRVDGLTWTDAPTLRALLAHVRRLPITTRELGARLQASLTAQNRLHKRLEETERLLEQAQEANMENGRRALELEARLGRLGAQLEAADAELAEAQAELERFAEDYEHCFGVRSAWQALFLRALALAVLNDARVREVSMGWSRAYHEADKAAQAQLRKAQSAAQARLKADRRRFHEKNARRNRGGTP